LIINSIDLQYHRDLAQVPLFFPNETEQQGDGDAEHKGAEKEPFCTPRPSSLTGVQLPALPAGVSMQGGKRDARAMEMVENIRLAPSP
jgi:hypothetical protein